MDFGPFIVISLFYGILAIRCVVELARNWRVTFDRNFTPQDRSLVTQAAFFVLVPISVALHELGHAVAIWSMKGDVLGFGYYGFAGYVEYDPSQFSDTQRIVIAFAGTAVNILLAALATGLVFFRRPPMRAAYNELLLQFSFVSLLNALVVYPALDLFSGLGGDWSQMYLGGVPWLTAVIVAIQAGVLALMWWMAKNPGMQARIGALTGRDRAPMQRVALRTPTRYPVPTTPPARTGPDAVLTEAAERVASGWPGPVEARVQQRHDGSLLVLSWTSGGAQRALLALVGSEATKYTGIVHWAAGAPPETRPLGQQPGPADADRLTLALRTGMEEVDAWQPRVTVGSTT